MPEPNVYKINDIEVSIKYIRPGVHEVSFVAGPEKIPEETLTKIDKLIKEVTGVKELNMAKDLRTEKELEDKKAMEEASKLSRPTMVKLGGEKTLENLIPMPPTEGPPLPRALKIRWPWVK